MDPLAKILSTLSHLDLNGEIEQREAVQAGFGGTCDVFMAWSKKHNMKVAIKRVRVFLGKDEKFAKKLAKEIRIWASLEHECVLPFLGYFVEGNDAMPSLISLWMANGTLDYYMEKFPRGDEDTRAMLAWIAHGLNYLHSRGVIHADLKSKNILISDDRKPLLADFGLSNALTFTKNSTTTASLTGTVRWMAIELFDSEPPVHTPATDVWAYGMVAYELLSGGIPYGNKADARVPASILDGITPDKPDNKHRFALFDPLWDICESCWSQTPEERPTSAQLYDLLIQMADPSSEILVCRNLLTQVVNLCPDSETPVTPPSSGGPTHGRNYYVMNVGLELWLDLNGNDTTEGNSIIGWYKNMQFTANQIWNFNGYLGEFTIQNLHSLRDKEIIGGGREGHLRIQNEKAVIGRQPFKWKLQPVGDNKFKFRPINRPQMSLTCSTEQAALVPDNRQDKNQQWIFKEVPLTPNGSVNPIHSRHYFVVNAWHDFLLDLTGHDPTEGNFVIVYAKHSPPSANQVWDFRGSFGECTLQNLHSLRARGVAGGGLEGHLCIKNKKTVIGRKPFKWKLEYAGNNLYKLHPANRPSMALTCIIDQTTGASGYAPQLLPTRVDDDTQHWAFVPVL